jgi:hypothetical protein
MDILGAASGRQADGAADDGERVHLPLASPTALRRRQVFRNMIAQHALGLGRPEYRRLPSSGPRGGRHPDQKLQRLVRPAVVGEPRSPEAELDSSWRRSTMACGVPIGPPC